MADKLLRDHYERLRADVIATVRVKLVSRSLRFPEIDLEAWYNAAWHGLYRTVADDVEEVSNPCGWLVVAMERRAIDEVRRLHPDQLAELPETSKLAEGVVELDFAGQLDDMDRIRKWRSGIRLRLSKRERQAAVLHFIQGFSRLETAELLGVPPRRADKIFDAITSKTSGLLKAIESGRWCDDERSLMVAFAAGVLDPAGERYEVALQHIRECPSCAAFVRNARNAFLIIPAPAVLGVATAVGGGALGATLGLAEVTSTGAGAGVTAGGAGLFGGLTAKTATMCASAVCLTGAGAGVAVVETVRAPSKPPEARAARAPNSTRSTSNTAIDPRAIVAPTPTPTTPTQTTVADPPGGGSTSSLRTATRKRRARPSPEQRERARAAAIRQQQENELGIEPSASTSTGSTSSTGSTNASSGTAPSASSASTGSSSTGGGSSGGTATPSSKSAPAASGGTGASEFGIE